MPIRIIATPLTMAAFVLMSITGVSMFFEVHVGFIQDAHRIFSWAFLTGILMHIFVHRTAIRNHLKKPLAKVLLLIFIAITIMAFIPFKSKSGEVDGHMLAHKSAELFLESDLNGIAAITHQTSAELVAELQTQGIVSAQPTQSVRAIAQAAHRDPNAVLALLLQNVHTSAPEDD
jgi:hypothetical protein